MRLCRMLTGPCSLRATFASPSGSRSVTRAIFVALVALVFGFSTSNVHAQQNVLILLADDLGIDMVGCYAFGSDLAPTPNIDALAASGVRFENVWSNPMCSPTRATILTGRYSFRTGIGTIVGVGGPGLSTTEHSIPRMLDAVSPFGYAHAAIGKWHLGNLNAPPTHPTELGFGHCSGARGNLTQVETWFSWMKFVNGQAQHVPRYVTSENVDDALGWIGQASEPWFCYLAFNAPHGPWHSPPAHLHTITLPNVDPRDQPRPFYKAAVQAMDAEIGRLLASMDPDVLGRTTVIFLGDNGTPRDVTAPPYDPQRTKLTVYEGGLRVPLIVSGPAVVAPGRTSDALVNTTDLFATVLGLAGVGSIGWLPVRHDSVSFLPVITNSASSTGRQTVYAEFFWPNGPGPYTNEARAIRDVRYKLIRRGPNPVTDELYDLFLDPFELQNLLTPSVGGAMANSHWKIYQKLSRQMLGLLAS
jgi:arylsulfatase A-like enzyme